MGRVVPIQLPQFAQTVAKLPEAVKCPYFQGAAPDELVALKAQALRERWDCEHQHGLQWAVIEGYRRINWALVMMRQEI